KGALVQDQKTGEWHFDPDLLDALVKQKQMTAAQQNDPVGKRFTLKSLKKLEPGFTADNLGRKITQAHIHDLVWAAQAYGQNNEKNWKKDGKWTLPKAFIADAIRTYNPGASAKDAWGHEFEMR